MFRFNKHSRSSSFEAPVGYVMGIGLKDREFRLCNFHNLDFGQEVKELKSAKLSYYTYCGYNLFPDDPINIKPGGGRYDNSLGPTEFRHQFNSRLS